ncbi:MAG: hypothetical protein ACUVRJ_04240 [Candidatus Villigracilaceae bacterium]
MRNYQQTFLALLALWLATLACTIHMGGPQIPDVSVPVSTEAAFSLEEQFKQAKETAKQTGMLTLQISEAQLTSYLTNWLQSNPKAVLQDPRVLLRDGQMQVYGIVRKGYFTANVNITISVSVNEQGQPKIEIVSADFGPLPVPKGLRDTIQAAVQEAYTGAIGPAATGFRLETIQIADGFMTLSGRVK